MIVRLNNMKIIVILLAVAGLVSCGSTIDPFSGSGPYAVSSSGRKSVAHYASADGGTRLIIEGGFLIGGHVSFSSVRYRKNELQYIGVLGQSSHGEYCITPPSALAIMSPRIAFDKKLSEASFSWMDRGGRKYHAKLFRL